MGVTTPGTVISLLPSHTWYTRGMSMASTKDTPTAKAVSKRIDKLCAPLVEQHGWRGAAKAIGVPTMTLLRATQGDNVPSLRVIIQVARYFKVSTDELLGI